MNEREALEAAMDLAEEMNAEFHHRKSGAGRTHKMRNWYLPKLFEILGDGLALSVPRVEVITEFGKGGSWTHVVGKCPYCGEQHRYWLTEIEGGEKRVAANCRLGDLVLKEARE